MLDFCRPKFFEQITHSLTSSERPERIAHGRSFVLSNLSNSLTVPHFLWATWAIHSQSLIFLELSEQIAHSCSFDLSEMSDERIPSPGTHTLGNTIFWNNSNFFSCKLMTHQTAVQDSWQYVHCTNHLKFGSTFKQFLIPNQTGPRFLATQSLVKISIFYFAN